ncbi:MAG: helix-turn-helix domain-containing protein [Lacisediminihabitans sp.]
MSAHDITDERAATLDRSATRTAGNPRLIVADGSTRAAVMRRLLSDDDAVARRAFRDAVASRWVDEGAATLAVAITFDESVDPVERATFGRLLDARRTQGIFSLGDRGSAQLFVVRAPDTRPVLDLVRAEAVNRRVPIRSIGTARHDARSDDLRTTVNHAITAAETAAKLPHLGGSADISELGTWLMLSSIPEDDAQIALFSPAAHALYVDGDPLKRMTVETYLDVRSQVQEACRLLHIHRTTLYYRLENMPPVVKAALDDGVARSALHLCLKLMRLWDSTSEADQRRETCSAYRRA